MAYIRHIPPSEACGRLAHVYREIRAEFRVPTHSGFQPAPRNHGEHSPALALRDVWARAAPDQRAPGDGGVEAASPVHRHSHDFLQAAGMDRTAYESRRGRPTLRDCRRRTRGGGVRRQADSRPRGIKQPTAGFRRVARPGRAPQLVSVVCAFTDRAHRERVASSEIPAPTRFETSRRERSRSCPLNTLTRSLGAIGARVTPEENRARCSILHS
jgi:hypothetical protein